MGSGAIYGTNSDELTCDTTCSLHLTGPIASNDAHDLLKYGCLRAATKGDIVSAVNCFDTAPSNWDGLGFRSLGSNTTDYYTHDLALALACANALGGSIGQSTRWNTTLQASIETRLWAVQDVGLGGSSRRALEQIL